MDDTSPPLDDDLDSAPAAAPSQPGAPASADPWQSMPDKFKVKAADGQLDRDASFAKMAEAHRHLEQRLGVESGRPESPDKYVVMVPEEFATALDVESPQFQAFRDEAFAEGFTARQLQFVIDKYAAEATKLVAGAQSLDARECTTALQGSWGDQFEANVDAADRALLQLVPDDAERAAVVGRIQNHAPTIRLLASVGVQLREDTPPIGASSASAPGIEELQRHPAYRDVRHPEHAAITARVNAWFSRQPGANNPI